MRSRDHLRYAKITDTQLDLGTWNSFVDFARSNGQPSQRDTFSDQYGQTQRLRPGQFTQRFKSEASQDCPPFGVMLLSGTDHGSYPRVFPGTKRPDTFGCQENFFINVGRTTVAQKFGSAQLGEMQTAAYDPADGDPVPGEFWGPRSGSFKLRKSTGGFLVTSLLSATLFLCRVRSAPFDHFYGQNATGSVITKGSTGTITIYGNTWTVMTSTGATMAGVLARYGDIAVNAFVECWMDRTLGLSQWFAVETDKCP